MSNDDSSLTRREVWTRHWASGATHSCAGSYGELYGGAIAAFWRAVLAPLPRGRRVLDIATGNGALPRLFLNLRPDLELDIAAIDLANIEPQWVGALPQDARERVHFHGGQTAESLPFEARCFDLIVSQYGIEYSDLERSLPELLRVLAHGGCVALLMHHPGSRPVTLAAVEIGHIDWLLGTMGLLGATRPMLELIERAASAAGREALQRDSGAESARAAFNAAQDALRVRASRADGADVLFEVQSTVARLLDAAVRDGAAQAQRQWQASCDSLRDARLRLHELCTHAVVPEQIDIAAALLRRQAGRVAIGEVHEGAHLMGWSVVAGPKPADRA